MSESTGRKKILVVEDNETLRESWADYFQIIGYDVITAAEGEAGLRLIKENNPDIVLTDFQMPPGKNGYWMAEQARECGYRGSVFIMSADNLQEEIPDIAKYVDRIFEKPISPDTLLQEIERATGSPLQ